jgi:hypothetical protein
MWREPRQGPSLSTTPNGLRRPRKRRGTWLWVRTQARPIAAALLFWATGPGPALSQPAPVPGVVEVTQAIDCSDHTGTVEVRKGATEGDHTNLISIGYTGTNCPDCHWYQFVWREIIVHTKDGHAKPKSGHVTTNGGTYDLTTDVTKPNWNPDSLSPRDPSYESGALAKVNANSDTIFDGPSNLIDTFAGADKANPNVTLISSLLHGESFLVCARKVCARVIWSVAFVWTRDGSPGGHLSGPEYTALPVDTSANPPNADQKKAINAKYPGQTVF